MWFYWLMFLVPAMAALIQPVRSMTPASPNRSAGHELGWAAVIIGLALVIGLRSEVGSDWFNYLENFERFRGASFLEAATEADPGFYLLMWLSYEFGGDIYAVNLVCAALFSLGLVTFCRSLPRPFLALAVAMPYLVIVVGMGYTRQAVALGCGMLSLAALQQKSMLRFVGWALLGATFHRTAVLLLPIAALVESRNRQWTIFWVVVVTVGAYSLLLSESVDKMYVTYVEAQYQSEGALVRLMMNAVPAAILLWRWKHFRFPPGQASLWRWFAIISLSLLAILFATDASTAVDRVGLYMLPLQVVVFSYLPNVVSPSGRQTLAWVGVVIVYYGAVLFVWLNFAVHSSGWLPYRFYPLEGL